MTPHVDFTLGAADAANVRFGISAPHELVRAVVVLQEPSRHPLQWRWLRTVRVTAGRDPVVRDALDLMAAVVIPGGYTPDFLAPPPVQPEEPLAQIRAIAGTPTDLVVRDLTKVVARTTGSRADHAKALLDGPRNAAERLAAAAETIWQHLLAPVWPQALHTLKGDLALRSRQLVEQGTSAVVDSLHERVSWHDGTVRVRTSIWSEALDCRGDGLLLVPSVFSWPGCHVVTDEPAVATIYYPAHGVAETWPTRNGDHAQGLERALGAARARVLLSLNAPTSTTQVAQTADISTPTATHHLTVLRDAGLVASTRVGREMAHRRTLLGEAVATGQL